MLQTTFFIFGVNFSILMVETTGGISIEGFKAKYFNKNLKTIFKK